MLLMYDVDVDCPAQSLIMIVVLHVMMVLISIVMHV